METFFALLDICAGNSPIPGEFPAQKPVTRSSDVFFDLRMNKRLSKQSWGWWFETPSCSLWRHCIDAYATIILIQFYRNIPASEQDGYDVYISSSSLIPNIAEFYKQPDPFW